MIGVAAEYALWCPVVEFTADLFAAVNFAHWIGRVDGMQGEISYAEPEGLYFAVGNVSAVGCDPVVSTQAEAIDKLRAIATDGSEKSGLHDAMAAGAMPVVHILVVDICESPY
jgi:hypothetical protein